MTELIRPPKRGDITGFPGSGKTSIKIELAKEFIVGSNGCLTSRPLREIGGGEQKVVSSKEFETARAAGLLIEETVHQIGRSGDEIHYRGIFKPEYWDYPPGVIPNDGTQLIVSTYGRHARMIKERYDPDLVLFFVMPDRIDVEFYKKKLEEHCRRHNLEFASRWETVLFYIEKKIWRQYDHIIFNRDGHLKEAVEEIKEKLGLDKWPS